MMHDFGNVIFPAVTSTLRSWYDCVQSAEFSYKYIGGSWASTISFCLDVENQQQPSICPFTLSHLSKIGSCGQQHQVGNPEVSHFSSTLQVILGLSCGFPLMGCGGKICKGKCQEGIQTRCLSHLNVRRCHDRCQQCLGSSSQKPHLQWWED